MLWLPAGAVAIAPTDARMHANKGCAYPLPFATVQHPAGVLGRPCSAWLSFKTCVNLARACCTCCRLTTLLPNSINRMTDEQRTKRSAKKPAWMNDEMLIDPAEVEP